MKNVLLILFVTTFYSVKGQNFDDYKLGQVYQKDAVLTCYFQELPGSMSLDKNENDILIGKHWVSEILENKSSESETIIKNIIKKFDLNAAPPYPKYNTTIYFNNKNGLSTRLQIEKIKDSEKIKLHFGIRPLKAVNKI